MSCEGGKNGFECTETCAGLLTLSTIQTADFTEPLVSRVIIEL